MAQDILITPKASLPKIEYTGSGTSVPTITQKILSTSIMQFDDGGAVLLEIDPNANTVSALNLETNILTATGNVSANAFFGNGSGLTNVTAEWDGSHTGNATITGALDITNGLDVTGNTVLDAVTGTGLTVQGNAAVTGTLNVTGTTTLGTVNATTVTGTTITGTTVNAPTLNGGTLDVSANATVDGTLTMNGNISAAGRTLTIATVNATTVTGTTITGTTVNAPTLNGGALDVSANATIDGTLTMGGNISAATKTLTIGTVNATTVTGTTITGTTVNAPTLNGGALDVSANAQIDGNLKVDGNVSGAFFYGDGSNLTNIAATAIDHGALAGRADDDHTQYIINAPANGTRNVITAGSAAALSLKGPVTPVADQLLFVVETNAGVDKFTIDVDGDVSGAGDILIAGDLKANSKSFLIDHPDPAKVGWKLQYTCLEGPENGVYTRGRSQSCCIDLPDYWPNLVHEDSLSVQITPFGNGQMTLKVSEIRENKVFVEAGNLDDPIDFFYIVHATRKDIPLLVVEHEPVEEGK